MPRHCPSVVSVVLLLLLPSVSHAADCVPGSLASRANVRSATGSWPAWGMNGRNTRFQSASGGLTASQIPRLSVKWAYSLGESVNARSQPAVVGGTVFVGSETGGVHAIDANSGCTRWTFKADVSVRTGIVTAASARGEAEVVYFGDVAGAVYGVNARTGARLWKTRVDAHFAAIVTGTPQLYRGVLYVPVSSYESVMSLQPGYECCTFRGSVVALNAKDGRVIWRTHTIDDSAKATGKMKSGTVTRGPSGAAVWSTPTIDEQLDRLYIGTGNNYSDPSSNRSDAIVALDRASGRIVWSRQFTTADAYNVACDIPTKAGCPASDGPDADFGQPPILVTRANGSRALVVGQKSGDVHALNPDREGALLWTVSVGAGGRLGGVHWGSAADTRHVYVALGGQGLRYKADSSVPGGYRQLPDSAKGGGLFALDLMTGSRVWYTPPVACGLRPLCSPAQSAPVSAIPGVVFSGSVDGHIRAYATANGKLVWDHDTARDYVTVNAARGSGGALDVAGPVIAGRMLFVVSGYALWGGMPGNVLIAYSVTDR